MALMMQFYEQDNLYKVADQWAHSGPGNYPWWPWGDFWNTPPTSPPNPALAYTNRLVECPADNRSQLSTSLPGFDYNGGAQPVAFTAYVGVAGTSGDFSNQPSNGILFWKSAIRFADITDGTSNTLMAGERPPSADLWYGWWFAGAGWDGSGVGDVVLGAQEYNYAASLGCPSSKVGFQPGNVNNNCDQPHFWSMHTNGGNFLCGDGSVHYLTYGISLTVLTQLCTRNGGESVTLPY
jgi:hypothetical protein